MSPDRLKQIAIALVAALTLWAAASLLRGGFDEVATGDFDLPVVDSAALTEISMVGAGDTVRLSRSGDGWRVNGHDADDEMVANLVAAFTADSTVAELVSVNDLSHLRMGVAESNGRTITLRDADGEVAEIVFGNRGPTFGSLFARFPDSPNTYLVRTELANQITRRRDEWRDHRILELDPDSIAAVEVVRRRGGYSLTRTDSIWGFADGSPADSGAVVRMLERFRSLRASGFAADTDLVDLEDADLRVILRGSGGDELAGLAFDSVGTDYWVRAVGGTTIFKMANWSVRQLVPPDSLLRRRQ